MAYGQDDRQALALLMLPFLLVAMAIGVGQSLRPATRYSDLAAPRPSAPVTAPAVAGRPSAGGAPAAQWPSAPAVVLAAPSLQLPPTAPQVVMTRVELPTSALSAPTGAPSIPAAAVALGGPLAMPGARQPSGLDGSVHLTAPVSGLSDHGRAPDIAGRAAGGLALAAPTLVLPTDATGFRPDVVQSPPTMSLEAHPPLAAATELALARPELRLAPGRPQIAPPAADTGSPRAAAEPRSNVCLADARPSRPRPASWTDGRSQAPDAARFGADLAAAAREQTREFVVYNDKYRRIAYPMGDVPSFYGVCTDVLIRAYRELGIDLQALVQTTRMGSGDPNIDHRRVDTLRRFFAAHGESLPVTDFAEDYRPGDIVSYWRPQNKHSRTHIAIVADEVGPSGRPMIIHNRGWGPQIEDGLFVDQITGHYRFRGLKSPGPARGSAAAADAPSGPVSAARRSRLTPAGPAVAPTLTGPTPEKAGQGAANRPAPTATRRREAGNALAPATR